MSKVIAYADVRARLTAANLGIPIQWPNEPFDKPEPPAPFLAVEVMGGSARPIELGGQTWEESGQAWVHVFVPTGTTANAAYALSDAIEAAFRTLSSGAVTYTDISDDAGSPGEDDVLWWRTSVNASWRLQTRTT